MKYLVPGLLSPKLRLEPQVRRGYPLPSVGLPASQGQWLNFWRVEAAEEAPTQPKLRAVNKELIKISDQNSLGLRTRWKLITDQEGNS